MSNPFFKPEDFVFAIGADTIKAIVMTANAKLNAALGPEVFGHGKNVRLWQTDPARPCANNGMEIEASTHRARLFNVQPIEPVKCEHEVKIPATFSSASLTAEVRIEDARCAKCGVRLKATWRSE